MYRYFSLIIAFALLATLSGCATVNSSTATRPASYVRFAKVFSDNMVLQRDLRTPVWGFAEPGGRVTLDIAGQQHVTVANVDGKWFVRLDPMPAGGPYALSVSGVPTHTLKNVLIGDVWLCSGQSNMEMNMRPGPLGVYNIEQELQTANLPNVRLFTVPRTSNFSPQDDLRDGKWRVCTPESIQAFTAVGFFFARELQQHQNVPIGLIDVSKGASQAEGWTSATALRTHPDFTNFVDELPQQIEQSRADQAEFDRQTKAWDVALDSHDQGYQSGQPTWNAPTLSDSDWSSIELPCHWETAGFPNFDGFMWFRKEVTIPESWNGNPLQLGLGTINDMDRVWVNGVLVGKFEKTAGWTAPRVYDVPASAFQPGKNIIAVRVYDMGANGGICGVATDMWLRVKQDPAQTISLAGAWRCKPGLDLKTIAPRPTPPEFGRDNWRLPTVLFNAMIAPIIPFGIRGTIWYQGESNAGRAHQYQTLFPLMIRDWRDRWGQGKFPFLYVQLTSFLERKPEPADDAWAELREAQTMTLAQRNTGMAVTIDIGDADNIHPRNKQDVGKRLALVARHVAYGETLVYSGPMYRSMQIEGNAIRINFDHCGSGLKTSTDAPLTGFAIAGLDKQFVWANAHIEGDTVVVSSRSVQNPVAVRYAWASNPACNLANAEGLPASPFRTDTWKGITEGVK